MNGSWFIVSILFMYSGVRNKDIYIYIYIYIKQAIHFIIILKFIQRMVAYIYIYIIIFSLIVFTI